MIPEALESASNALKGEITFIRVDEGLKVWRGKIFGESFEEGNLELGSLGVRYWRQLFEELVEERGGLS